MLRKPLALGSLMAVLLVLTTCGSGKLTSVVSPNANTLAPSLAELADLLSAELTRLGKDPSKVVAAAPSGQDNAVFDLSGRIIGAGGTSSVGTGVPPVQIPSSANVPVCDSSSTSAPACAEDECASTGACATTTKTTSVITGIELSWTERIIGDYDQNGEVNLSDLAPLAIEWGTNVAYDDPTMHSGFTVWPTGDPDGLGTS